MDSITQKVAQASIALGKFVADKRNAFDNYEYISADAVLARAGDALAKVGVALYPEVTETLITLAERQGEKPRIDAKVVFAMRLSDGESEKVLQWVGMGNDYKTPDKALYKAITSGHKYFLMKLLCIGTGNEDGEHESDNGNGASEPARKPVQQPKQQPKQTKTLTYEQAKALAVTVPGKGDKALGGMSKEQLDWVIAHVPAVAQPAQVVLAHNFPMTTAAADLGGVDATQEAK